MMMSLMSVMYIEKRKERRGRENDVSGMGWCGVCTVSWFLLGCMAMAWAWCNVSMRMQTKLGCALISKWEEVEGESPGMAWPGHCIAFSKF